MKKFFFVLAVLCATMTQAATVYTRINAKPAAGWPGTYLIVYEKSDTEALVWDGEESTKNFKTVAISNGQITSEDLSDCHVTVSAQGSNFYLKVANGYIGCGSKNQPRGDESDQGRSVHAAQCVCVPYQTGVHRLEQEDLDAGQGPRCLCYVVRLQPSDQPCYGHGSGGFHARVRQS